MQNPFEAGVRKVIPATLIYLFSGNRVLMLHRNRKEGDFHAGKWNGIGGKLELDEAPLTAAARETKEETGIDLPESAFKILGVLQFPNFKPKKAEDWLCWVCVADVPESKLSELRARGPEGDLEWIAKDKILDLNLWENDRMFIPHVLARETIFMTIRY